MTAANFSKVFKRLFCKELYFILCLSGIGLCGFSQAKDYIVKSNSDTVWGEIRIKNNKFYVNDTEHPEISTDNVIKIKSSRYRGSSVLSCTLQQYSDNLAELEFDYIIRNSVDTILVLNEIYSTPKMNLYYAVDELRTPYYFYKTPSDSKPIQLVIRYYLQGGLTNYGNNRAKYRGEKSKVMVAEDKGYVNQLHAIMEECNNIPEAMWELLSYREYSFKQLIRRYNKCN